MKQLLLLFGLFPNLLLCQIQGSGGLPNSMKENGFYSASKISFPEPNLKQLKEEDKLNDEKGHGPWRFGYNNETNINTQTNGTWFNLNNGGKIWLLEIECKNAITINLTLQNVSIPEGNSLFVYDETKSFILGEFTENHLYEGNLGTELVPGNRIFVEYYSAPQNDIRLAQLEISKVTHGYRTSEEFSAKAFGSAGSCNMNVNCPDGTDWTNQKRSVVMLVNAGGNGFCSGALINNTLNDGKPYVLTANHCYSNPLSWVFRFNWEAADCTNPGVAPSFSSLSGSVLRARRTSSDFCLVEITGGLESGTIPTSYNSYFSGWDNTGDIPNSTVTIHHPKGDIKKISFDDASPIPVQTTISGVLSDAEGTWQVEWDRSTTVESASSGSPLFDQNYRIIGQLWGGQGSCAAPNANDYYGRISKSWEPLGSTSIDQLKIWLDPTNIGAQLVDGFDPSIGAVTSLDATLLISEGVNKTNCSDLVTPKLKLVNLGSTPLTSLTINYGFDGLENLTFNWVGNLIQYQTEEVTLPVETLTSGPHTFSATCSNPNSGVDEVTINNNIASSLYTIIDGEVTTLDLILDCYGSETSWNILDQNNVEVYKSEGYSDNTQGLISYDLCLAQECYSFQLYDKFSDGMSGCASGNGSYIFKDASSNTLAQLIASEADFGASYIRSVCLGTSSILNVSNGSKTDVYPNPSKKDITILSTNNIEEIRITDMNGKTLYSKDSIQKSNFKIDVSNLSNGVYFIQKVNNSEGKIETIKLIKE